MKGFALLIAALLFCTNKTIGQINTEIERIEQQIDSVAKRRQYVDQQITSLKIEQEALLKKQNDLIKSKNDLMINSGIENLYICEMDTYIYDSPARKNQLKMIKKGTIIKALETKDKSYRVVSDSTEGWVSVYLVKSVEKIRLEKEGEKEKRRQDSISVAKNEADFLSILSKKYGNKIAIRIVNKEIWIGMTDEMLLDSWGKPNEINRTVNEYGTSEQWVYGDRNYVYIDDGIVSGWQD
jgi:hypothetical protein